MPVTMKLLMHVILNPLTMFPWDMYDQVKKKLLQLSSGHTYSGSYVDFAWDLS